MIQIRLGYTIGTLADHPSKPDSAGVYNRNTGWPPKWTRVSLSIQLELWLTTPMNQSWLGYTIGTLTNHSNELESAWVYNKSPDWPLQWTWFLIYLFCIMTQVDWTNHIAKNLKKLKRKQKNQKRHLRSQISKKATMHFLFLFPCSIFFITWLNSIGQIGQQKKN